MKSFEDFVKEVSDETNSELGATPRIQEVITEAANRFAKQVATQALIDASERVKKFEGVTIFVRALIRRTPIVIP